MHKYDVHLKGQFFDRLITGGRDGILKIWNYNNGHCLKVLKKGRFCHFLKGF